MMCARSYCASKKRQFQAEITLPWSCWVLVVQHLAFMQIYMSNAVLRGDGSWEIVWNRCTEVCPDRQQWRARRSAGRILAPLSNPPPALLRCSLQQGGKDPHSEHGILHPHRISRDSRECELLRGSSATGKGIQLPPAHSRSLGDQRANEGHPLGSQQAI